MTYLFHQAAFVFRFRYINNLVGTIRKLWYVMLGMKVGKSTVLSKIHITWPNQVEIGKDCILERNITLKCDGIWKSRTSIRIGNRVFIGSGCEFNIRESIEIGDNSLIASGCRFIDHDHGIGLELPMNKQHGPEKPIKIGADVWLGCNVVVLKGVAIEDGAIVAAGAIVTKSIQQYEIWAGVPARKIGQRT
jgi:acetyltransferase-like isoleucine patch superfamily enzyme